MAEGLDPAVWLRTSDVCTRVNVCAQTLRRYQQKGVFEEGVHFIKGPAKNSPVRWNFEAVARRLQEGAE